MGDRTAISWTEATWNPVTGCTEVSEGCDHCYARSVAHRFAGTPAYPRGFEVTLRPERLDQPLRWRRPRMIFVNSMSAASMGARAGWADETTGERAVFVSDRCRARAWSGNLRAAGCLETRVPRAHARFRRFTRAWAGRMTSPM